MITFGAWRSIERKRRRKRQPDRFVHLHLVDARQHIFHRVFDRDDLAVGPVDEIQDRNKASSFCRNRSAR